MLLQLEILYRTPIAYLYPQLYQRLKSEVRNREGTLLDPVDHEALEEMPKAPPRFSPRTIEDVFAIFLARELDDVSRIRFYASLARVGAGSKLPVWGHQVLRTGGV